MSLPLHILCVWPLSMLVCTAFGELRGSEYSVDLNKSDRYRAIFEAGLHPRHPNGMGEIMLEVRPDTAIGFKLLNWHIPPIKAVWGFNVDRSENVSSIEGVVSAAWTKSEAYETVAPLELALGGDQESLKKMKAWIDGYPESAVEGDTWGRKAFSDDKRISAAYYFRHTMQPARPLSCTIVIQFWKPQKDAGFHEGVLKPPPGYEHLDLSTDYTYGGTVAAPKASPQSGVKGQTVVASKTSRATSTVPWWLPWLVLAVVAAVWWALRGRKHDKAP